MASVVFVPGQMQEFISNIEFSLNLDNSRIPIKVRIGEIVLYDGITAKYTKSTGEEIIGKTSSLKSAINNNWLTLNVEGVQMISPVGIKTDRMRDPIQYKQSDYNPLTGGGFNEYLQQEVNQGNIAAPSNVIRQEDQIVKRTGDQSTPGTKPVAKLEVAGDQVSVKESAASTVSSSTAVASPRKAHKTQVIQAEDYGAARTQSFKNKTEKQDPVRPKNTYTVDTNTPKVADDASLAEVKRATTTIPDERQDGQVVKKIGVKGKMQIQEDGLADARVVKRIGEVKVTPDDGSTEVEGIKFNKVNPSVEKEGKATVTGSEPIVDLSGVKTQAQVNAIEESIEGQDRKVVGIIEKKGAQNFLDKLPKNWSEMHWVQKEKFIMEQTDKEFVKFILTVEPTKAVQNACRKKLLEIEKAALAKNA